MALTQPRGQFGIHSLCFYNRTTGIPISYLRILGESNVSFEAEMVDLEGGSQNFPYDTEVSKISSDISVVAREYDAGTMEILMGGALTENSAEATGAVDGIANVKGTSIIDDATGLHTISVTSGDSGDLKEGKYILKATTTDGSALQVYCNSDVDFQNGTDTTFSDDTLLIGTLDMSGGDDVTLADYGLIFQQGSSTTAWTINDTAEFYVRKVNSSSIELVFGQAGAEFTKVGVLIAGQKQSDGTVSMMELYNCLAAGMPIQFGQDAWSEWSITIKALYDSSKNAIGKFYRTIAA